MDYCLYGHELRPENVYVRKNGKSYCMACRRVGNTKFGFEDNICRECRKPKPPVMPGNGTICHGCNIKNTAWRNSQPEARAKRSKRQAERREFVITHYGGKCNCCQESRLIFLQIDHINDDGYLHRKTFKGVIHKWIHGQWRKTGIWPDGFQILCANCHMAKTNFGRCPCQDNVASRSPIL